MRLGGLQVLPPSAELYMAMPISAPFRPGAKARPASQTLPALSQASVGSEMPAQPGSSPKGAASSQETPPSNDA